MGSQRVGDDWMTFTYTHTFTDRNLQISVYIVPLPWAIPLHSRSWIMIPPSVLRMILVILGTSFSSAAETEDNPVPSNWVMSTIPGYSISCLTSGFQVLSPDLWKSCLSSLLLYCYLSTVMLLPRRKITANLGTYTVFYYIFSSFSFLLNFNPNEYLLAPYQNSTPINNYVFFLLLPV